MTPSYSLMHADGEFPPIADGPAWNDDRTVLTTVLDLAPGYLATFTIDGSRLLVGGENGELQIWDARKLQEITKLNATSSSRGDVNAVALLPDPRGVLLGCNNGDLLVYRLPD